MERSDIAHHRSIDIRCFSIDFRQILCGFLNGGAQQTIEKSGAYILIINFITFFKKQINFLVKIISYNKGLKFSLIIALF